MGTSANTSWSIREIPSGDVDYLAAVHLAVMSQPQSSMLIAQPVRDLLESAEGGGVRLRPVVGGYEHEILRVAVLGVESPGGSNLMLLPFDLDGQSELVGGLLALRGAKELSANYDINLSQIVGPERASKWDAVFEEAGFVRLTELIYMTRSVSDATSMSSEPQLSREHRWFTFRSDTEHLFAEAIRRSYVQSMDCPELMNVRTAEQALSAHRAVGAFNPATWFVLTGDNGPMGVLLLSKVRREPVMEIVYMGVSQVARGSGVADLLMDQAMRASARANAKNLILAVDARNEPATRLYTRHGYVRIARRSAWIANLCAVGR